MKIILAMILLAGFWYTSSLRAENQAPHEQAGKSETAEVAADPGPGASAVGNSPRSLTNEAFNELIAVLSSASGSPVWFVTQGNDPEAASFQQEIEDAFLQAGWKVAASAEYSRPLRAGVMVFAADDELSDHVSVAVGGLRSIGLDVFAGAGYRAFYERQKEKNPDFSSVELAPDQDFVIVVGPNSSAP